LAASEAVIALGAIGGSVALIGGAASLGSTINARLPFKSPVLAGIALFFVVAIPMTAAAISSFRGAASQNRLAMYAGAILMGWIVIELAFIRSFSWLQPAFFLAGAAVSIAGYRRRQYGGS
jgi:hypothetical protein